MIKIKGLILITEKVLPDIAHRKCCHYIKDNLVSLFLKKKFNSESSSLRFNNFFKKIFKLLIYLLIYFISHKRIWTEYMTIILESRIYL